MILNFHRALVFNPVLTTFLDTEGTLSTYIGHLFKYIALLYVLYVQCI